MPALDFDVNGHIATVTLNRPEARNAFNPEVLVRLHEAFHEIEHNDHIRVAIITGSGDKAFCAGADLGQLIPLMTGARQPDNEWDERYLNDVSKKGMYLVSSDPGLRLFCFAALILSGTADRIEQWRLNYSGRLHSLFQNGMGSQTVLVHINVKTTWMWCKSVERNLCM